MNGMKRKIVGRDRVISYDVLSASRCCFNRNLKRLSSIGIQEEPLDGAATKSRDFDPGVYLAGSKNQIS